MPGLYGYGNANVTTNVTNTTGLYIGNGSATILNNAGQLLSLLSNVGTVGFALTSANTQVLASVLDSGVTAGVYGADTLVPQITVGSDGRVTNVINVPISGALGSYGNANVAAYLPTYTGSLSNSSDIIVLYANAATQATSINLLSANLGAFETYANATFGTSSYGNSNVASYLPTDPTITGIQANVGAFETYANVTFATKSAVQTIDANLGTATTNITTLFANAAVQSTAIQTLSANVGAYETWANAQIATIPVAYSNSNVASYLPVYGGNVLFSNLILATPGFGITSAEIDTPSTNTGAGVNTGIALVSKVNTDIWSSINSQGESVVLAAKNNNDIANVTVNGSQAKVYVTTKSVSSGINKTWEFGATNSPRNDLNGSGLQLPGNLYIPSSDAGIFYANGSPYGGGYGNTQVAAYLPSDPTIYGIQANIGAFETYANLAFGPSSPSAYGNANVAGYLPTYSGPLSSVSQVGTWNSGSTAPLNLLSRATVDIVASTQINLGNVTAAAPVKAFGLLTAGGLKSLGTLEVVGTTTAATINATEVNSTGLISTTANMVATGNLVAGQYVLGDGSLLTNLPIQPGTYGDSNVAAYLPTDPTIYGIQANLGTATTNITTLFANAATQSIDIQTLNANIGAFETYANLHFADQTYSNANAWAAFSATSNSGTYSDGSLTYNGAGVYTYNQPTWIEHAKNVRLDVKNTSGGPLAAGTPVYATGTVGATDVLEVSASRADTAATLPTIGLLETALNNNDFGSVVQIGFLNNVNTNGYTVGARLYVGATGGITNVRPNDGYTVQFIGTVGRVNASTGIISVDIWDEYGLPNLGQANVWYGPTGGGLPVQRSFTTLVANDPTIYGIQANIGAFETYANVQFATNTYSNTNVAAYLNGSVTSIQSPVATSLFVTGNDALQLFGTNSAYLLSGTGGIATVQSLDGVIRLYSGNIQVQGDSSSTRTGNIIVTNGYIKANGTVTSNGFYFNANGVNILTEVATKAELQTTNANLGAFQTYANATFGTSSYGNTDVAGYLYNNGVAVGPSAVISSSNTGDVSDAETAPVTGSFVLPGGGSIGKSVKIFGKANVGNLITSSGVFWANGVNYSSTIATSAPFLGNLAGNVLYDGVYGRIFANASPLSAPSTSNQASTSTITNIPVYTGGILQQPASGNQTLTSVLSANVSLQSKYDSTNRNTVGTLQYLQVWPSTANNMTNSDRVRAGTTHLDVQLNGKQWTSSNISSQYSVVGSQTSVGILGTGYAGQAIGQFNIVTQTPTGGSANIGYATGTYSLVQTATTGTGYTASNIGVARMFTGCVIIAGNLGITNAVGLHTASGWGSTATNKYAILNEDSTSTITTNGNIVQSGFSPSLTATFSNVAYTGQMSPGFQFTANTSSSLTGNVFYLGNVNYASLQQISLDSNISVVSTTAAAARQWDFLIFSYGTKTITWPATSTVYGSIIPNATTYAKVTQYGSTNTVTVAYTQNPSAWYGNIDAQGYTLSNAVLSSYVEKQVALGSVTGTVTIVQSQGPVQTMTLTGSITINTANLSGFVTGESVTLILTQGGTGSYTLTSDMKFAGASKTLSTAVGAIDTLTIYYDGTNYLASLVKGYA